MFAQASTSLHESSYCYCVSLLLSYRKANVRLRKMGRPEIDVSSSTLKMRNDIENEVEKVVTRCGFRRVKLELEDGGENSDRTAWNRTLQLYRRI